MTKERTDRQIIAEAYSDEARATWKAPVQVGIGSKMYIPWDIHLEAYEAYCKKWSQEVALIDLPGCGCRGGFGTRELESLVPGWRDRVTAFGKMQARIVELEKQLEATKAPIGNSFILLYQPPVGLWYVHSHKIYCSPADAEDAIERFITPGTPVKIINIGELSG